MRLARDQSQHHRNLSQISPISDHQIKRGRVAAAVEAVVGVA
jgi:hypothetical protein